MAVVEYFEGSFIPHLTSEDEDFFGHLLSVAVLDTHVRSKDADAPKKFKERG